MCSKPKIDTSIQEQQLKEAQEARRKEEERQARIRAGTEKIDQTFSAFDDNYYNGRRQDYINFYQPQLDDQFKTAQDQLTYALARAGTLNSSLAAHKQAELTKLYDVNKATVLSQADEAVAAAKSRHASEKSSLVAQLNATGDADRVSNEALARSQQLFQEKNTYSPIGDIFSGIAAGIGNYYEAQSNRNAYNAYFGGGGSSRNGTGRLIT